MASILIVEDEELIRNLCTDFLEIKGYKVETAENGQKGLDYLNDKRPDIILLNINIPKFGGKEFLKIIKADNKLRSIPVLLMSGGIVQDDKIAECLSLGAVGCIEKANSPVEVKNNIEMILGAIIETPEINSLTKGPRKLADLNFGT